MAQRHPEDFTPEGGESSADEEAEEVGALRGDCIRRIPPFERFAGALFRVDKLEVPKHGPKKRASRICSDTRSEYRLWLSRMAHECPAGERLIH